MMMDATLNLEGWEHSFYDRLFASLLRSDLQMSHSAPIKLSDTDELASYLSQVNFNCLLLFAHGDNKLPQMALRSLWEAIRLQPQLRSLLFALCNCASFDPQVSIELLKSTPAVAAIAVAGLSAMTPREAGLFYLKFFTELKLHSEESITGKMAWFSFSKARELLRRRRYSAQFGIRC